MPTHPFTHDTIARWFFLLLTVGIAALFWKIIAPFATTLVTAAIVAILVTPFEKRLRTYAKHSRLSALIILLIVLLIVVGPLTTIGVIMVQQAVDIATGLLANPDWLTTITSHPTYLALPQVVREALLSADVSALLRTVANWASTHVGGILSSGADLLFKTFIFFICLYFFLVDREKILKEAFELSPLRDSVDRNIVARMVETVRGVVFGSLIVACVQGVIAGIGLTIFGVPGALIWAALVIIAAQVPMLGTATVMIPAVIYLFATGNVSGGIGLAIWAGLAVGLVDNLLQPYIVGGKTRMHALLILLSMLGGLQAFGPVGFILGPTVLAAFLVILELYKAGFLERKNTA